MTNGYRAFLPVLHRGNCLTSTKPGNKNKTEFGKKYPVSYKWKILRPRLDSLWRDYKRAKLVSQGIILTTN